MFDNNVASVPGKQISRSGNCNFQLENSKLFSEIYQDEIVAYSPGPMEMWGF